MKQSHKSILLWLVLIAIVVVVVQIITADAKSGAEMKFSEFRDAVAAGAVEDVTIHGDGRIDGRLTEDGREQLEAAQVEFETVGRVGEDLQDLMLARGVTFTFERDEPSIWQPLLSVGLPLLIVVMIFFFFMRQLQAGGGKAMSFGKSKARLLNEAQNKVTFDDIAGIEEAKEELTEIVEFLRDPKKFTRLGGRIPKGVLLMGPPGTGKTLLGRGVAGEAGVPFFSISGSDFVEMFVGVGASRVRDLFEQGKKHAPCIIFIDEIDAVGRHRGAGMGGGHDEREQTLNQLLVEMDGFESNEGVILIAATNRPDVLDPALLRPGRFDRHVVVPAPDAAGREGVLTVHTRRTPLAPDVDLSLIAKGTPGFSGADLENLVNEAALIAARKSKDRLEMEDFEEAKDKVIMGVERRSATISDRDRRVTAYHEAGHALVAALLPQGIDVDPLHKVTIIPRGRALGVTQQLPAEDRLNVSKEWAVNRIAIAMGGRAAEEIVFQQITTGAGQDLQQATNIARKMVCEWGMSDTIGPISFNAGDDSPFLGRDYNRSSRPYSEETAVSIDKEIQRLLKSQYDLARQLLLDNMHLLRGLSEALLEFEVLDRYEIDLVMAERIDEVRAARQKKVRESEARRPPARAFTSGDSGPRRPEIAPALTTADAAGSGRVSGRELRWHHRRGTLEVGARGLVMGIVNVTPDSFSDGGRYFDASDAVAAALAMIEAGADLVDIGGESTRPGAEPVSAEEELRRVVPVVEAIRSRSEVVISIDTTKTAVAEAAVQAGADVVNDVSGGLFEPQLLDVVARTGAGVVLTHTPARPSEMLAWERYDDVVATVVDALGDRLAAADAAGIARTHVALDPGFGFGKNAAQNMALLRGLDAVVALHPLVLAGVSRKRMIREHVGTDAWRLEHGTTAAHALALAAGATVIRAHDVAAARACVELVAGWREAGGAA